MRSRLRLYCGPEESAHTTTVLTSRSEPSRQVKVPAGEVFSVLADAIAGNRAWLQDFSEDEITVSSDLYEVILAYQHFRRPSA